MIHPIPILSAIASILYTAYRMETITQIWILPIAFVLFCVSFSLLYWLLLAVFSLGIRLNHEYDEPSRFYYKLLNSGYCFICSGGRVKLHVSGLDKIPAGRKFLFVSNHLSRFDPMIQSLVLKDFPIAFISKPSNFKIPIGRRYMTRSCYMAIDRENPRNALKTINHAADLIASDIASVGVYPEGHRGNSLTLQEFKAGCLRIAVKADCPIVVATICGTEKIHKNFPFRRTEVDFDIIDVIEPQNRRSNDLADEIKDKMQKHLLKKQKGESI